jgi:hypothetical protein
MAEITKEQFGQLEQDESYMRQSGLSQADIDAYREERLRGWGLDLGPGQGTIAKEGLSGSQKAALFAGPALGGFYGAQLTAGRNALPFLAGTGRAITQFAGESGGIAAGDVAGRFAAGVEQNPSETAKVALGGGALGTVTRGLTQAGGMVGNVPKSVLQSAAEPVKAGRVPLPIPNLQRVARAGPHTVAEVKAGLSPEVSLVDRAAKAAGKLKRSITAMRLEKEAIIRRGDASGVRIPIGPIKDALRKHLITDPGEVTTEAGLLNRRINDTINRLDQASQASGGTLKPSQIDKLIREQLRPRVYTGSGRPSHTMYAAPIADAEEAATELLSAHLPGDIAQKNMQIAAELRNRELAYSLFGDSDKAGVSSRIATAFKPNNETTARALNILKEHDESLVDDAFNLYARRSFAGDIRSPDMGGEAGWFGTIIRKPAELVTRGLAPFQRFAGGAGSGAYEAFYNEMQQKQKQRNTP